MSMFSGFHTSASGLTAQRLRLDTVSSNIANAQTTRGELVEGKWQPYARKLAVLKETASGVTVSEIRKDSEPFKLEYNPNHPDADELGYVKMPNVDLLKEMVDMMGATRSYEANVTALNATKAMLVKAMEIGK
ncbi:flagellar basal body rod protein FlgC [Exiguobacterium flavidum]|uniref:flagellar basal body rod protein FlgC n=1 Tax=Exiguobacterium flavidum TaxID=2184695 RepID=UPI000DF7960D|nr:flagellar basal body rod protein FlgC [Exiguobacterium flavidum]